MPITPDIPAAEAAIVDMTNAFRRENKLSSLTQNPQLAAAARAYAQKLAADSTLSHTAGGTTPETRAKAVGYTPCLVAENLAKLLDSSGFSARNYAKRVMAGWRDSPGHRKNLLLPHLTEIGVAVARAPARHPTYVAVQLFGRPASLKYEFVVRNEAGQSVSYDFAGKPDEIQPRETVTHKACMPKSIDFRTGPDRKVKAHYEARDGDVYTLKPRQGGGVTVEVSGRQQAH
jgi:hypothetical protein